MYDFMVSLNVVAFMCCLKFDFFNSFTESFICCLAEFFFKEYS